MMGLVPLYEETGRGLRYNEKTAFDKPGSGLSSDVRSAGALILDLKSPEL